MGRPPILHRQLDRCDVCGTKIHKHKLVRTQVRFVQPESENQFLYSSYDDTFWTATEAVANYNSIGTRGDKTRVHIANDNTLSMIDGVATWDTAAKLSAAITDVSGMTNVCMSVHVGAHQASLTPSVTLSAGYVASDSSVVTMVTRASKSAQRVFWTLPVASLTSDTSATVFWFAASSSGDYWLDDFQLEDDTSPGEFLATSGTAESYGVDTALMTVRKVCPSCRERLLKTTAIYTQHRSPVSEPIPMATQEV